jgi:hypothetical protein
MADFQIPVFLYGSGINKGVGSRDYLRDLPQPRRDAEARGEVKMLLLPRQPERAMAEHEVPDDLVTQNMIHRYLQLDPPFATVQQEFQVIIRDIDYTYVQGVFFSTVSAACVTIERLLNRARIELHPHVSPKIGSLWGKEATNEWSPNIDALETWGYLEADFASELRAMYRDIRCRYLHTGAINDLAADALQSARAGHRLLGLFVGFPPDLFTFVDGRLTCRNEADPRFIALYKPHRTSV